MGLTSVFNIGRSAMTASQFGLQIAGNNLANAANPTYSRQTPILKPGLGSRGSDGMYLGGGVRIEGVRREISEALQQRLRAGIAQQAGAQKQLDVYASVEASLNELTGYDLSSQLSNFFNGWSERANLIQSSAVIVQQGEQLAGFIRQMRDDLMSQRMQIDRELDASVDRADSLLREVAELNVAIAEAEQGRYTAAGLRDQRDQILGELAELLDVSTIEHDSGAIDVLVGSTPVVLAGISRGLELHRRSTNGQLEVWVAVSADQTRAPITDGRIGALLETRDQAVDSTVGELDTIAGRLIFEINKIHANGANLKGLENATGTVSVGLADRALALNDPSNSVFAGMPYTPTNGGFLIHVKNTASGATQTIRIDVDLDGRDATGALGFSDDTSAEDIRAAIDAISGLSATFDAEGRLSIDAAPGMTFGFAEDSSGALAALGVNAYFTGTNASDIAVRDDLIANPSKLMVGRIENGTFVENATALEIAALQTKPLDELGGESLRSTWSNAVQRVANRTSSAITRVRATGVVRESLEAQRAAISGVSIDEEIINLLTYQRQFQGAARLIAIADEMFQTLLSVI